MVVLTKNPALLQIPEINENFTKHLLLKFGSGRLKIVIYFDESGASRFCCKMNVINAVLFSTHVVS